MSKREYSGYAPNASAPNFTTPFHMAAHFGHRDTCIKLLEVAHSDEKRRAMLTAETISKYLPIHNTARRLQEWEKDMEQSMQDTFTVLYSWMHKLGVAEYCEVVFVSVFVLACLHAL